MGYIYDGIRWLKEYFFVSDRTREIGVFVVFFFIVYIHTIALYSILPSFQMPHIELEYIDTVTDNQKQETVRFLQSISGVFAVDAVTSQEQKQIFLSSFPEVSSFIGRFEESLHVPELVKMTLNYTTDFQKIRDFLQGESYASVFRVEHIPFLLDELTELHTRSLLHYQQVQWFFIAIGTSCFAVFCLYALLLSFYKTPKIIFLQNNSASKRDVAVFMYAEVGAVLCVAWGASLLSLLLNQDIFFILCLSSLLMSIGTYIILSILLKQSYEV